MAGKWEAEEEKGAARGLMWWRSGYPLFLLLSFFIMYITCLPLDASLWTDEILSFWVARGDILDALEKAWKYQGQSPVYFLIVNLLSNLGFSEVSLRLLSVFFICGAAVFVFLLAALFGGEKEEKRLFGIAAFLLFLSYDGVVTSALSVRPYAMALLGAAGALFFACRWRKTEQRRDFLLSNLCLLLAFYSHYLFGAVALLTGPIFFIARKSMSRRLLFGGGVIVLLLCLPGFVHLYSFQNNIVSWSFASIDTRSLLFALASPKMLLLMGGSFIACWITLGFRIQAPQKFLLLLSVAAWCIPPLVVLGLSGLVGVNLFVPRYFAWQALGAGLLAVLLVSLIAKRKAQRLCIALLWVFALSLHYDRQWNLEQWREASLRAEEMHQENSALFAYTGLIELEDPEVFFSPEAEKYLAAPFSYYWQGESFLLLPLYYKREAYQDFVSRGIPEALEGKENALIVFAAKNAIVDQKEIGFLEHYQTFFNAQGFSLSQEEKFGEVGLAWFTKTRNSS